MSQGHFDIRELDRIDRSELPADGGPDFNRLIFSQSPYLLQHARNPVDWYPWGDEAFERARTEDKPVLLSIGYSTCHWCHVMAHESFEDPSVAAVLKADYIAIKVDREERPDIDNLYMTACQLMTGSGGWPLTLVLTPGKQPFFAATYLPRSSRGGMYGLLELLDRITDLWREKRSDLVDSSRELTAALKRIETRQAGAVPLDERPLRQALEAFRQSFDLRAAGFGDAPKFPTPHNLSLLLRLGERFSVPEAGRMACATLDAIRAGGIYDQFGFGLHRYAVDADWQVPHFEKMLYDQALFMLATLDAYQLTGEETYARMAAETAEYLLRDLRSTEGGFYSGEDADSEGEEGTFYLWTPAEVFAVLEPELADLVCRCYGITVEGNFEGQNIPHMTAPLPELAGSNDMTVEELEARLQQARQTLLAHRENRIRPHRDDKIVTAWNGLAIAALARSGAILDRPDWLEAAAAATDFLLSELIDGNGRLLRSWRKTAAPIPAFAEDYACLAWGLLELHQAGYAPHHLAACREWTARALDLFTDTEGEFWDVGNDAEQIIGRGRSTMDGAVPSAGSVMCGVLLRLGDLTGDDVLQEAGRSLLAGRLGQAVARPTAFTQLLMALDYLLGPTQQLVICVDGDIARASGFLREARQRFLPHLVSLLTTSGQSGIEELTNLLAGRSAGSQGVSAYLCSDRTCQAPVHSAGDLAAQLDRLLARSLTSV